MKMIEADLHTKEILDRGYVRRLAPDETGGYVATILEFPGCIAEGDTADEALKHLDSAAESWIEVALANGQHIREPIDFDGFSGKTALRMPKTLHKQAADLALQEGCSLNQFLVTAVAHYVGGKQLATKIEAMMHPILLMTSNNTSINTLNLTFTNANSPMKSIPAPVLKQFNTGEGKPLKITQTPLLKRDIVHG